MTVTDTHATTDELLDPVFSFRSVPRLYKEEQLQLRVSRERVCCRQLRVAAVRSEKLVAEAWDSSGTQRKGNVRR
jgi:hypothetical protein